MQRAASGRPGPRGGRASAGSALPSRRASIAVEGRRGRRARRPFQAREQRAHARSPAPAARRRGTGRGRPRAWPRCAPSCCDVELPDERRAGPDRAHQRVLAAHEVEVAGPEQAVEVGLREQRQRDGAQRGRGAARRRGGERPARRRARRQQQQGRRGRQAHRAARRPASFAIAEQADAALAVRAARCRAPPARRRPRRRPARRSSRPGSRSRPPVRVAEAGIEEPRRRRGSPGPRAAATAGRASARRTARR